jgi:hypothetical protein
MDLIGYARTELTGSYQVVESGAVVKDKLASYSVDFFCVRLGFSVKSGKAQPAIA